MANEIDLVVQVPIWARWIAQDRDGSWRVFAGTPKALDRWWDPDGGQSEILVKGYYVVPDWRSTLRHIK